LDGLQSIHQSLNANGIPRGLLRFPSILSTGYMTPPNNNNAATGSIIVSGNANSTMNEGGGGELIDNITGKQQQRLLVDGGGGELVTRLKKKLVPGNHVQLQAVIKDLLKVSRRNKMLIKRKNNF